MIEVMSHLNSQEKLKLPKNIRQIGLPEEKKKIYVEDYVVTYMRTVRVRRFSWDSIRNRKMSG